MAVNEAGLAEAAAVPDGVEEGEAPLESVALAVPLVEAAALVLGGALELALAEAPVERLAVAVPVVLAVPLALAGTLAVPLAV